MGKATHENVLCFKCMLKIIPKSIAYAVNFFYIGEHIYRKVFIQKAYRFAL